MLDITNITDLAINPAQAVVRKHVDSIVGQNGIRQGKKGTVNPPCCETAYSGEAIRSKARRLLSVSNIG